MRLLVTGREGQLARSLAERFVAHPGIELIALGRPQLDLAEAGSVARAIREHRPDLVINAAAYTNVDQAEDEPELAFRVNADAAGEAAAAARAIGARNVHVSTDYVFDGRATGAYAEEAPTNPLSVYGRSKLAGEEQVRAADPDHMILRTSWVYSPFGRNFVKSMMSAARDRDVLTVVEDQAGSPTSALDLADAILEAVRSWRSGTYHVAGFGQTSWCGLARAIMAECRRLDLPSAQVEPIRTEAWPTKAARPRNSVLDCSKFARDFGIRLPDWRGSIAATVERLALA